MKINASHYNVYQIGRNRVEKKQSQVSNSTADKTAVTPVPIKVFAPSFGIIESKKNILDRVDEEKQKLQKQLEDILGDESQDSASDDAVGSIFSFLGGMTKVFDVLFKMTDYYSKKNKLALELRAVQQDKRLNNQQKFERQNAILKKIKNLESKPLVRTNKTVEKNNAESKEDLVIINKFKTAVSNGNLNLDKVAKDYYSGLNNITKTDELKKCYPKIKLPASPKDVVAKKFVSVLTKDFYLKLENLHKTNDEEAIDKFLDEKIKEMLMQCFSNSPEKADIVFEQAGETIKKSISDSYNLIKQNNSIDSVPENRKVKLPQISAIDVNLLSVDYDDFVTTVVRDHFYNDKKLNEIVYDKNGIKIPYGSITENDYKISKQSEKIKTFIKTALKIKSNERNYDAYDDSCLKRRLEFFATEPMGSNEEILDIIVRFACCDFNPEDKNQMKLLFKELDKIVDSESSVDIVSSNIKEKNIIPVETERRNEEAKIQAEAKYKEEQKLASMITKIKTEFDETMNILYCNGMSNIARICSEYRPENIDDKDALEYSNLLCKIINDSVDYSKNEHFPRINNKEKLTAEILGRETYNKFEKSGLDKNLLDEALKYSLKTKGKEDKAEAGRYILNYQVINQYPKTANAFANPDVLKIIIEKSAGDKTSAVECLCKYCEYNLLSNSDKAKLSKITEMFNLKQPIEKAVLEYIVKNDYVNVDTSSQVTLENGTAIPTRFCSEAKKKILDKYKFPGCMKYLDGFEYAIERFAPAENATGIKQMVTNKDKSKYKIEAKIANEDDRLFSQKNNYCFDIYSEHGEH